MGFVLNDCGWSYHSIQTDTDKNNVRNDKWITYTNNDSIRKKIISITVPAGVAGNGITYTAGNTCTGDGTPITVKLQGTNGINSDTVTISNTVGREGTSSYYPPRDQMVNTKFSFSQDCIVSPGSSVSFSFDVDSKCTGVLVANLKTSSSDGIAYLEVEDYKPPITGSVNLSLSGTSPVLYNNSVTITGKATTTAPAGYSISHSWSTGTSSSTGSTTSSTTISHVTSRITVRDTVTVRHANYTGTLTATQSYVVECKLRNPSVSVSGTSPILCGNNTTATASSSDNLTTPGGVTFNHSWNKVSGTADLSSTSSATVNISNIRSKVVITDSVYVSKSGYVNSDSITSSQFTIECKLNAPTVSFPNLPNNGYTVGLTVGPTCINGTPNPSSMTTTVYHGFDGATPTTAGDATLTDDHSTVSFRARSTKADYVASDYSSTITTNILLEPRKMTDAGFSVTMKIANTTIQNSSSNSSSLPDFSNIDEGTNIVIPGSKYDASWSSFKKTLNYGNFNYYKFEVINGDRAGASVITLSEGTNNPETTGSTTKTLSLDSVTPGKWYRLKLTCMYRYSSGTRYASVGTGAVFTSARFFLAGFPDPPQLIYPYHEGGTTTQDATPLNTANVSPRIVFIVSNPPYLPNEPLTNVAVTLYLSSGAVTYTYKNNSSMFKLVDKSALSNGDIPSGTTMTFTFPTTYAQTNSNPNLIYAENKYLSGRDSGMTTYFHVNKITINEPTKGSKVLWSENTEIKSKLITDNKAILLSYKTILKFTSQGTLLTEWWSDPDQIDSNYKIQRIPIKKLLDKLGDLYSTMVSSYGSPNKSYTYESNSSHKKFNELIDTTTLKPITYYQKYNTTSYPPYDIIDDKFTSVGNYFSYIMYYLKYLL